MVAAQTCESLGAARQHLGSVGGGFRAGRTPRLGLLQGWQTSGCGFPSCPCGFREAFFPLPRAASRELPSKGQSASMRCSDPWFSWGKAWVGVRGPDTQDRDRNLPAQVGAAERILWTPGHTGLSSRERTQINHRRHHCLRCCRSGILPVDSLQLQTCSENLHGRKSQAGQGERRNRIYKSGVLATSSGHWGTARAPDN